MLVVCSYCVLLLQVFVFILGNTTSVIKSVLNRRVSPSCADSSGACSTCSTGKREMIKGSKSPGQMKRIEEKKIPSGNLDMDKVW